MKPRHRIAGRALGLAIALASAAHPSAAAAGMADLFGVWEQVASSAGPCPACTIAVRETPEGAVVVANNGWRADLPALDGSGPASGSGRWQVERVAAWVADRPFTVRFRLGEDGLLAMTMTVDTGSARRPVVRARYRRVWLGM